MNIENLRSQFTVFIFFPETELTPDLKQLFASSGYETFMFIDEKLLIERIKQSAPHVILFSPQALKSPSGTFFETVLGMNSEIQFACVAPSLEVENLLQLKEFGLAQFISEGDRVAQRALWAIDNICEKLALTYQNENLLDQYEHAKEVKEKAKDQIDFPALLIKYESCLSKEELVNLFLKNMILTPQYAHCKAVFFKFLPTVTSYVATLGINVDLDKVKGVGTKINADEVGVNLPPSLLDLVRKSFKVSDVFAFPLMLKKTQEGLFVVWAESGAPLMKTELPEFSVFQLVYQNFHFYKKVESLETTDLSTDLFNAAFYIKRIEEEVNRAKRLTLPVSIVKISVDRFAEIESKVGVFNRDLILKSVALLIRKTSRSNDFGCRTGTNEITLALPHSTKKGAALRAERLRRAIENHSFALNGIHVTVSMGVSEYPSLCRSAKELDSSARHSLHFIENKGGNKVCIFTPNENFKPEFQIKNLEG